MKPALLAALAIGVPACAVPVRLEYRPPLPATTVGVAGTFNGWRADANPMRRTADGAFVATLDLEPGPYQYKFVVDGRWVADPKVPGVPPSGNSPLMVAPDGRAASSRRGDGKVLTYAIRHDRTMDVIRTGPTSLRIRLRTAANDVTSVLLDLPGRKSPVRMASAGSNGVYETWTATVPVSGPLSYRFRLLDGKPTGPLFGVDGASGRPFTTDIRRMPLLKVPAWVPDAVWYQVFPERFRNGDPANDVPPPKGISDWEQPLPRNANAYWYGGDLAGIREKLPYIKSLGATALYLNPIFDGPDTHKYATTDYMKIAPEFGTEADLKALVTDAHAAGMRVMLDGVFNHTSIWFFAFRDLVANQQKSRYVDWYHVRRWPVLDPATNYQGADERSIPYDGWWGVKWMPKLNTDNPEVRRYLLDVATHWIKDCDIDGWRLDVANEVSQSFWPVFRNAVKAAKPDAFILGEIWENAAPWLKGDQFDSVMNYRFRGATLDFFARGTSDAAAFVHALDAIRNDYPPQAAPALFNLLGSHDTPRLLNECGGDHRRDALATLFQMSYPGSPCVYYGDENGMMGGGDPMNRAPMVWDEARWSTPLRDAYRKAIALRRQHPALRGADVKTLLAEPNTKVVALRRSGGGERAVVAFNASDSEQTARIPASGLNGTWSDAWNGGTATVAGSRLTVTLPAYGAAVLFQQR